MYRWLFGVFTNSACIAICCKMFEKITIETFDITTKEISHSVQFYSTKKKT